MIPVLLYVLATLDATFCGYRAAAGWNARIDKREYYRRALRRGAMAGQVAVLVAGAAIAAILLTSPDPAVLWRDLMAVGARMLLVYVPYALLLLLGFLVRRLPSVDARSLTSTLIFGPFTFARPFVVIGGLLFGLAAAPRPALVAVGLLVGFMMLSLESLLSRAYRPASWP